MKTAQTARETYFQKYKADPVRWVNDLLDVHLWSKQREIIRSVFTNRRTVVPSGHAVGKTFVSACTVLAFMHLHQPCKVITTAPTWAQVEKLLWSEINTLWKTRLAQWEPPGAMLTTQLKIRDDWFALGLSPNEQTNFQGFHQKHILVVIDEAPGVDRDIYLGAETLMTSREAHMLMIGNPIEQSGHFYEAYVNPDWVQIPISCLDSPNFTGEDVPEELRQRLVTPEWAEEKQREWGEDSSLYIAKVLGKFPEASEDQLIPLSWAEAATRRESEAHGDTKIGVDVARFGDDKTVYSVIQGNRLMRQEAESKKDTMEVAGKARRFYQDEAAKAVYVDDVGVGGGVTDRLREQGVSVVPVNAGEKAIDSERFANKRAEMWWMLREWICDDGSIPNDTRLIADLTAPKFTYTSKGQIKLESKDETKKRLGRSPDFGDSLAITMAVGKPGPILLDMNRYDAPAPEPTMGTLWIG